MKNSPILDDAELDEQAGGRDLESEEGVCYFNGQRYGIGEYVLSGSELLKCSGRGVWVRTDEQPS